MTGDTDNLIHLRRLDEKLGRLFGIVADLGRDLTSLETKIALLRSDCAAQSACMDRVERRLDQIERRLEIVHA